MQSGYDMNVLVQEAKRRWLKPVEVYFILQNYDEQQINHQVPQKPTSGSLYLFNKRVLKFFRKDGHSWRRRRDQRTIAEAHERLKVGNAEALNCYYAHGEVNPNFQRRSYWILDPAYEHIVLVHYRDIEEGRQDASPASQFPSLSYPTFGPSPNISAQNIGEGRQNDRSTSQFTSSSYSYARSQPESSVAIAESYDLLHNESSPSSVEISSHEVKDHGVNQVYVRGGINEAHNVSEPDLSRALQSIEHQLSLNDDEVNDFDAVYLLNEGNGIQDVSCSYDLSGQALHGSEDLILQHYSDGSFQQYRQLPGTENDLWSDMLSNKTFPDIESLGLADVQGTNSSLLIRQEVNSMGYPTYSSELNACGVNPDSYSSFFEQAEIGISLDDVARLTVAQKQKFTIRELSPEWCYVSEGAKIFIIGSFLSDPSECIWACMFGDTEVPVQIIQEGVLCCHAPPHLQGKVTVCVTSGNRESCSEVREFEYRDKPSVYTHTNPPDNNYKSLDELLLLVRFVQMLLSDRFPKETGQETKVDLLEKPGIAEDPWSQTMASILDGTSTSSPTLDWLLQELLKDKLDLWLVSRLQNNNQASCPLSKNEQGIIHMVAGLGYEWALQPILNSGVNINFRDINGWTALHWAARFGREKMVAALIASGASAGAVTDPNSQDPKGKVPASIAEACGHTGLAAYLSEVALTSHLLSLTLEESEMSKGSAAVEAERTLSNVSLGNSSVNEDQVSLRNSLAAVRNAAEAAARIQSAFRAHSFRKRQQREAADEYGLSPYEIQGLSAASKLAFGNASTAALSIQKNYRGWKGRKIFLTLRQKVVMIQAHVRGYQVRKHYKVCWAVSILEKVVLRWRRHGVGLRGFKSDIESIEESEDEEDILKVFRKRTMDPAIDEAVSRVLSMVESPEARQQYHRLLQKYRQAKAELKN